MGMPEFVAGGAPVAPDLPLYHTTSASSLSTLLNTGILKPEYCDVLDESVSFFFYGRPAFRDFRNEGKIYTDVYYPITFVFDCNSLPSIHSVYPFDTGAFGKGLYGKVIPNHMKLSDYSLPPSIDSCRKIIGAFYGSTRDYFLGGVSAFKKPDPLDHSVKAFMKGVEQNPESDDRRYTIEVTTRDEVQLNRGLTQMYLSHELLQAQDVTTFLASNPSVAPDSYPAFKGITFPALYASLMQLSWFHMTREGRL